MVKAVVGVLLALFVLAVIAMVIYVLAHDEREHCDPSECWSCPFPCPGHDENVKRR